jgi:hypothetical protein
MMQEETMHATRLGLALAIGLYFSTSPASAILIDTGTDKPVGGFVISDDGTILKLRVPTKDGRDFIQTFDRAKIKIKIIHKVDVQRLEGLSPDNPLRYFFYAEQLAHYKEDPEARERAKQLYVIAAKLKQEEKEFVSQCLRGMSELADTETERRKYLALAVLLDPKVDEKILKTDAVKPAQLTQIPPRDLDDFIKALYLYRTRNIKAAEETAKRAGMDKIFNKALPGRMDLETFLGWCTKSYCPDCDENGMGRCPTCRGTGEVPNRGFAGYHTCEKCRGKKKARCSQCDGTHVSNSIDDRSLRIVLQCEKWALEQQGWSNDPARDQATGETSWSAVIQSRRPPVSLSTSLDTLIKDFDPSKCLYRDRKWVGKLAR